MNEGLHQDNFDDEFLHKYSTCPSNLISLSIVTPNSTSDMLSQIACPPTFIDNCSSHSLGVEIKKMTFRFNKNHVVR